MKISVVYNRIVLFTTIAVFSVSVLMNWLKADIPYWPLLLREAGFILAEIPPMTFYRSTLVGLLEAGSSALLLLLNYQVGKKYKLTRTSTAILLTSLSISVLLGLLLGYGAKQIQMPQYSIFTVGILYLIPGELGSKIAWCMLGVVVGNYKTEIENTSESHGIELVAQPTR